MPKPTQQEQFLKIKDFIDSVSIMAGRLLRDVPKCIDIMEESLESNSNDMGDAVVKLLRARKEAVKEEY